LRKGRKRPLNSAKAGKKAPKRRIKVTPELRRVKMREDQERSLIGQNKIGKPEKGWGEKNRQDDKYHKKGES